MFKRLRILFTEGASLSARQTLYSLGGRHQIDVLDPDPLCQCRFSSFVRRWIRSPSYVRQPEDFLRFLAELVRSGQYDVLLPTHEQVYLLSRFRDAFLPHVGLALPEFAAMERMQNKAHFSRLLAELDLYQPETIILSNRAELNQARRFPLYLKLPHSTAGGGVFFIDSEKRLRERVEELEHKGQISASTELILQQPARGVVATAQAVFNQGQMIGVHCFESRRLGVGGMSTARTSADHPEVRLNVERIGSHLAWHGALFIDYFFDRDTGRAEYIECNPRIGETVNSWLSGVNLPEMLVQMSAGQTPPRAALSRTGVRTHNLMMILMSAAYEGRGRGAIVQEVRQFVKGQGIYQDGEDEITRPHEDRLSRLPRFWVTAQLLACPSIARRIVAKTVKNYSLPESATERIKSLPLDLLK